MVSLGPTDDPVLMGRRRLLEVLPGRHAPWLPEADPVLESVFRWFGDSTPTAARGRGDAGRELGSRWRPDFVLLEKGSGGVFPDGRRMRLRSPSWDPAEKLGKSVVEIHSPVPTLNAELGPRIGTFMERLPADGLLVRENWGLAAVPDRNLHPALQRPRLTLKPIRTGFGFEWNTRRFERFRDWTASFSSHGLPCIDSGTFCGGARGRAFVLPGTGVHAGIHRRLQGIGGGSNGIAGADSETLPIPFRRMAR